mgnify:CR=1 FL=1
MVEPANIKRASNKLKKRERCEGSSKKPSTVVSKGKTYKSGNKVKGERPTGICPTCYREFSLALDGNSWVMRRHLAEEISDDQFVKISNDTWKMLNQVAALKEQDADDWANTTLNLVLTKIIQSHMIN